MTTSTENMKETSYNNWYYSYINNNGIPTNLRVTPDFEISQPRELCKYFAFQDYNIEATVNNYFYGSHPIELNDPFDINKDLISFQQDYYNFLFSYLGILSMTENDLDPLMWSHYCSHKGFVVRYSIKNIPKNFNGPFPINYIDDFKTIECQDQFLKLFIASTIKYKKHWQQEKEWRFILYSHDRLKLPKVLQDKLSENVKTDNPRYFYYKNDFQITEVILGYKLFINNDVNILNINNYGFDINTTNEQVNRFLSYLHNEHIKTSVVDIHPNIYSQFIKKQVLLEKSDEISFKIRFI